MKPDEIQNWPDVPSDPNPMPEPQTTTENPNPNEAVSTNNSDNLAAGLDGVRWIGPDEDGGNEFVLTADELAAQEAEADTEAGLIQSEGLMTRDQFFQTFRLAFDVPQVFDKDFEPLAIQPNEEQAAKLASDGIYALLLRHPWTRKVLQPQGEIATALLQAGPFLFAKIQIVRMILIAKAAPKAQAAPEPANLNGAPEQTAPVPDDTGGGFAEPVQFGEAS